MFESREEGASKQEESKDEGEMGVEMEAKRKGIAF